MSSTTSPRAAGDLSDFEGPLLDIEALSDEELRELAEAGFYTIGIVLTLVHPYLTSNSAVTDLPRFMVLEHRQSLKNGLGAIGPLGETARMRRDTRALEVEHPWQTMQRGISEELGLQAANLDLRVIRGCAGFSFINRHENGYDLVISPIVVLGLPEEVPEEIDTPEIATTLFVTIDMVEESQNLRSYSLEWKNGVENLMPEIVRGIQKNRLKKLVLPAEVEDAGWQDVRFAELAKNE